jgi:hypothetical protein
VSAKCSLLVYRLGYGPFKAEGGVRFPGGENFFPGASFVICSSCFCLLLLLYYEWVLTKNTLLQLIPLCVRQANNAFRSTLLHLLLQILKLGSPWFRDTAKKITAECQETRASLIISCSMSLSITIWTKIWVT